MALLRLLAALTLCVAVTSQQFEISVSEIEVTQESSKKKSGVSSGASGFSFTVPDSLETECKSSQDCYGTAEEFERTCARIQGLKDGGRCFYRTATKQNWADSIKACANQGGYLAQVHGASEVLKLYYLLKNDGFNVNDNKLWYHTALARATRTTASYGVVLRHTMWYHNYTYFHPRMSAANTYIRAYESDEVFGKDQNCLVFYDFNKWGDWGCGSATRAMCMLINRQQSFRLLRGVCVAEEPAEELQITDPQQCADACSHHIWCRSFNIYDDGACRLFSWSVKDNPAVHLNQPWCVHFTYNH